MGNEGISLWRHHRLRFALWHTIAFLWDSSNSSTNVFKHTLINSQRNRSSKLGKPRLPYRISAERSFHNIKVRKPSVDQRHWLQYLSEVFELVFWIATKTLMLPQPQKKRKKKDFWTVIFCFRCMSLPICCKAESLLKWVKLASIALNNARFLVLKSLARSLILLDRLTRKLSGKN